MRWKDQRCVSQSFRLCGSCLCFFFYFRFCVSAIHFSSHFSSHIQQSCLAQHNRSTQQVSVFCCLIQYYTLGYLKYFMSVQIRNHHVPWIFSSETILIITWRKMKVACPTLKYYAHLPDTCNYVKNQEVLRAIERKVLHQKLPPWSFNFSGSSLFLCLHLDHVEITFACFLCLYWMKRLWQPNVRETNILKI